MYMKYSMSSLNPKPTLFTTIIHLVVVGHSVGLSIQKQLWPSLENKYNQEASYKSVLPIISPAHVVNLNWLSNQDQTLAHFRDHIRSTLTYNWSY